MENCCVISDLRITYIEPSKEISLCQDLETIYVRVYVKRMYFNIWLWYTVSYSSLVGIIQLLRLHTLFVIYDVTTYNQYGGLRMITFTYTYSPLECYNLVYLLVLI